MLTLCRLNSPHYYMTAISLPHFNKVLAGELPDETEHFQLEQSGNYL